MPSNAAEHHIRTLVLVVIAFLVVTDGGVPYAAAAIAFAVLSAALAVTAKLSSHRPLLHRLRVGSLAAGLLVCIQAGLQVRWDETGVAAHPIWQHLTEQFGTLGGTLAIARMQAIWELPGALIPFVAFAVAILLFRRGPSAGRYWSFLAVLGTVFATYGLLQSMFFPTWHFGERSLYSDSLTGFYVNRNVAASLMTLTALATAVVIDRDIARFEGHHWQRLFLGRTSWRTVDQRLALNGVVFLVQFAAIFLTRSRAGAFIGLFAISTFLALRWRDHFAGSVRFSGRWRWLVGLGLVAGLVLFLAGRVADRYDVQGLEDGRWCVYPAMMRMAFDNLPWGVGLGGFTNAFASYRDPLCGVAGIWDSAHDLYIQGLATMGIVFPLILSFAVLLLAPPLVKSMQRGSQARPQALATVIAIVALAVHSIVDFPLEIPGNATILAVMIATTIAASTDRRRTRHRRARKTVGSEAALEAGHPDEQRPFGVDVSATR